MKKQARYIVPSIVGVLITLVLGATVDAIEFQSARVIDPAVFWEYSTAPGPIGTRRNQSHIYTGGWKDEATFQGCADRSGNIHAECDQIYLRVRTWNGSYTEPQKMLGLPGHYLNDPTLLDCGDVDCMYMTVWNGDVNATSDVGLAVSVPGSRGKQWTYAGSVITAENSWHVESEGKSIPCGAWAPSALWLQGKPRLFYHLPWGPCGTRTIRTTLEADGVTILSHEEVSVPFYLVNIDVMPWHGGCLMVGDAGAHFEDIWLFRSDDCLHFDFDPQIGQRPLFHAGQFAAFTPSLRPGRRWNEFILQFTYTPHGLGDIGIFVPWTTSIHEWTFTD